MRNKTLRDTLAQIRDLAAGAVKEHDDFITKMQEGTAFDDNAVGKATAAADTSTAPERKAVLGKTVPADSIAATLEGDHTDAELTGVHTIRKVAGFIHRDGIRVGDDIELTNMRDDLMAMLSPDGYRFRERGREDEFVKTGDQECPCSSCQLWLYRRLGGKAGGGLTLEDAEGFDLFQAAFECVLNGMKAP